MSQPYDSSESSIIIAWADIKRVVQRGKQSILLAALMVAFLAAFYKLSRPVTYTATALFKEHSSGSDMAGGEFKTMLSVLGGKSDEAVASLLMQTRGVLEPVVQDLNLQAGLQKMNRGGLVKRLIQNAKIDWLSWYYTYVAPPISDLPLGDPLPSELLFSDYEGLRISNVHYTKDTVQNFELTFFSDEQFHLIQKRRGSLGDFRIGETVQGQDFAFTLTRPQKSSSQNSSLKGKKLRLSLLPEAQAAENLKNMIKIKRLKEAKSILQLSVTHSDRLLASDIVNSVMQNYHAYLKAKQRKTTKKQMAYLQMRQSDCMEEYKKLLQQQMSISSERIKEGGFPSIEQEMTFLNRCQSTLENRLFDNAYKQQFLASFDKSQSWHMLPQELAGAPQPPQEEIHRLLVRRNLLQNALTHHAIIDEKQDAENLLSDIRDSKALLFTLSCGFLPPDLKEYGVIERRPHLHNMLKKTDNLRIGDPFAKKDARQALAGACDYVRSLIQNMQEKMALLQEGQNWRESQKAFLGASIEVLDKLVMEFALELEKVQSTLAQMEHIYLELDHPRLDLSGLSVAAIADPVFESLVEKANATALQMQDSFNRSVKDQQHLRETYHTFKGFLKAHLQESMSVLDLRKRLLEQKIGHVQHSLLQNIDNQMEILQEQVMQSLDRADKMYESEKQILGQQKSNLLQRTASLPQLWMAQKELKLSSRLSTTIIQEIAKAAEAKNISSNLNRILSHALDAALPPIFPNRPKALLYLMLGAVLGAFFSIFIILARAFFQGFPASVENLSFAGQIVAGSIAYPLKSLLPSTIDTIRRLCMFVEGKSPCSSMQSLVLHMGGGGSYAAHLAVLLAKKGRRVLLIEIERLPAKIFSDEPLERFLAGQDPHPPPVDKTPHFDKIHLKTNSGYLPELLSSDRFQTWRASWQGVYDIFLLATPFAASSLEAKIVSETFEKSVVTLRGEKVIQLQEYFHLSKKIPGSVAFVFSPTFSQP